jgi:AraC family transcriptional regulator
MLAGDRILADIDLGDATVSLIRPRPSRAVHETYCDTRHLLAMYGSPALEARGRYLGSSREEFSPIGSVFFRPAGLQLECQAKATRVDALHCRFSDERLARSGFRASDWTERQLEVALDVRATHLFSYYTRLINEIMNPGFGSAAVIDSLLTIMLTDLTRHIEGSALADEGGDLRERTVRMLVERICDVWEIMPRVSELAELAGVSERHLLRLFRERKGTSLADFMRQTRLEKARYLLGQTDMPLKQLAYRLGFASHSAFATAFRFETGLTPSAFRHQQKTVHSVAR